MKRLFAILSSVVCLLSSARSTATELTDLGQGLAYLGIQSLADAEKALRSAVPGAGALVLDLRHVSARDDSLDALRTALNSHATGLPLLVLVSPATPPPVADAVAHASARIITLGVAGSRPGPRVIVKTDPDSDRRACDALVAGTPVETLISGKVEKDRFDEAALVEEFKNGNPDAAPPETPDPAATKPGDAAENPPRLVDRVLQRAVHLHHALLALRG